MPKQAKNNPVPRNKAQNKESADRDRAFAREAKAIFARANDPKPTADDPRLSGGA
ncbi:hypothetical protein [Amycolatopsis benzoatilytica]|uniref:hypothetical protein n=1 Tax=Amycolatopsis benzoatilytica TaxID=346045 RepID=UPI000379AE56|nr:hypothetical protein [Amycolatopsis benzoatilytica]